MRFFDSSFRTSQNAALERADTDPVLNGESDFIIYFKML